MKLLAIPRKALGPGHEGACFFGVDGAHGGERDAVLVHDPSRMPRGARGPRRLEKAVVVLEHDAPPEFALLHVREDARAR
jgi:hypothetical protein